MTGHGGDIYTASERLHLPIRRVMDFSASVNPFGPSKKVKAEMRTWMKMLDRYPDPECRRLVSRLSRLLGIPGERLLCGNGSNELIHLLMAAVRPARVLVTAPTFSEYGRAAALHGAQVVSLPLCEEHLFRIDEGRFAEAMRDCDAAFLCNPNNPAGTLTGRDTVLRLAEAAGRSGCLLVVDEAFIDFIPGASVIDRVTVDGSLAVLRSLTKFHGLAGLRIGFGAFPDRVLTAMRDRRDPWSVNTLAQRAACVAVADKAFVKETLAWLDEEKKYLEASLSRLGFAVYPSAANYLLIHHKDAASLRLRLYERGILVRDCSNFEGLNETYLRVAVHRHKENSRLVKTLQRMLNPRREATDVG